MHATLCDVISDIVQNSIEAESHTISLEIEEYNNEFRCSITDDGKGMDKQTVTKVLDPFYTDGTKHTKRVIGLGLPFLKQSVDAVGGTFSISSEVGKGTAVTCTFITDHIDCPPVGDLVTTLMALLVYPGEHELLVTHHVGFGEQTSGYKVTKSELMDVLGDLQTVGSLSLVRKFLQSQEESIEEMKIHA